MTKKTKVVINPLWKSARYDLKLVFADFAYPRRLLTEKEARQAYRACVKRLS